MSNDSKIVIKPLTAEESKWIKKAQKLFASAPDRFDFLTIGDANLAVIDGEGAKLSELFNGQYQRDGIELGRINTKGLVHGVSG